MINKPLWVGLLALHAFFFYSAIFFLKRSGNAKFEVADFVSANFLAAMSLFIFSFIVSILLYKSSEISTVLPLQYAINLVLPLFVGICFLGENVSPMKMAGLVSIFVGCMLVAVDR